MTPRNTAFQMTMASPWEGLGQGDPWKTWTSSGGLSMKQMHKEAKAATDGYCPGVVCP